MSQNNHYPPSSAHYMVENSQINQFANDGNCIGFIDVSGIDRRPFDVLVSEDGKTLQLLGGRHRKVFEISLKAPHNVVDYEVSDSRDAKRWEQEFGISYMVPPEIYDNKHLEDVSYHNDGCPHFEVRGSFESAHSGFEGMFIWVEHVNLPARQFECILDRVDGNVPRYTLQRVDDGFETDLLETEDLEELLKYLEDVLKSGQVPEKPRNLEKAR